MTPLKWGCVYNGFIFYEPIVNTCAMIFRMSKMRQCNLSLTLPQISSYVDDCVYQFHALGCVKKMFAAGRRRSISKTEVNFTIDPYFALVCKRMADRLAWSWEKPSSRPITRFRDAFLAVGLQR